MRCYRKSLFILCFFASTTCVTAQNSKDNVILSAIRGADSKPDTIWLAMGKGKTQVTNVRLKNDDQESFQLVFTQLTSQKNGLVIVKFKPPLDFIGITYAKLYLDNAKGETIKEINLTGLSTKALEGENEPPLSLILKALGYNINLGWKELSNHIKPQLEGDELPPSLFQKVGKGNIEIFPVARYSPDFELPFGYYTNQSGALTKHQVGILSKSGKHPEHQTLFPAVVSGTTSFDPGNNAFGFYTTSPSHTGFSEDIWNIVTSPTHAIRAARVYPVRDKNNKLLENIYIFGFEEARNGDYNDYIFLIKNVRPVNPEEFVALFNGRNFDGWTKFIHDTGKDIDTVGNFRIENGMLHVIGKEVGYVITKNSYTNYHLRVDFKWGEKKWPPRENAMRDAGICYHVPLNETDKIWPRTIECQIQEGDTGDFWLICNSTIEVDGKPNLPGDYTLIAKKKDAEKPFGEWNTVEVISYNGRCIHMVNGEIVNYGANANLKTGRILLQSEYAEVYYKDIKIKQLQ